MDNFFIADQPFHLNKNSPIVNLLDRGLQLVKAGYEISPLPDPIADMNTIEQRINYFHLLDAVISNQVPGDVVELGCFTGQCAMLFEKVIEMNESDKKLHLYDSFESKFSPGGSVEDTLKNNFRNSQLALPALHKGYFEQTIPDQLPTHIAFAHIDCGPAAQKKTMLHCLASVYPRLSKGGVCVMMDYYDTAVNTTGYDVNPGVKFACDEFLRDKPEKIISLYGNQYSHGFFKKV